MTGEEVRIRINPESIERMARWLEQVRKNTDPIVEALTRLSKQLEPFRNMVPPSLTSKAFDE